MLVLVLSWMFTFDRTFIVNMSKKKFETSPLEITVIISYGDIKMQLCSVYYMDDTC